MKSFLALIASWVFSIYAFSVMLFIPYYNWEYAKQNGFLSWLLLGEFVPTAKAIVWPYFAFSTPTPEAINSTSTDPPQLSARELDAYSKVLRKLEKEVLTGADLDSVRYVLGSYTTRTNNKLSQKQYEFILGLTKIANDYQYELGTSALFSWDRKQYTTTNDFDLLREKLKGFRKAEKLSFDLETIKAAAANQTYVQDESGQKYEFGREIILGQMKENELMKQNTDRLDKVVGEFIEQR